MKALRVSWLLPESSNWHVWFGHATTKLSAYRQYVKECKDKGQDPQPSNKLDLKQYEQVVKLSGGRWTKVYQ